mgnify:FL=1
MRHRVAPKFIREPFGFHAGLHDNRYEFPLITYLQKASRYPILEKLIKSGFEEIVARWLTKDGPRVTFQLRAKTIQKALDLNSDEMDYIRNSSNVADTYRSYLKFRSKLEVSGNFAQRIEKHERFGRAVDNIVDISKLTGLSHEKTMGYIGRQTNGQDTHGWIISSSASSSITTSAIPPYASPRNLWEAHNRLTKLISNKENTEMNDALVSRINSRKWLEFESGRFVVIQPQSVGEIIVEGKRLDHCVGGYIGENAAGNTNIMFLRMKVRPWKPFYIMEIDNMGVIRQCHGYGNGCLAEYNGECIAETCRGKITQLAHNSGKYTDSKERHQKMYKLSADMFRECFSEDFVDEDTEE